MTKHAPFQRLPWEADDENGIYTADGFFVARINDPSMAGAKDAVYIAHAASKYPDMVEALQQIAVTSKGYPNASREGEIARACLARIDETPLT